MNKRNLVADAAVGIQLAVEQAVPSPSSLRMSAIISGSCANGGSPFGSARSGRCRGAWLPSPAPPAPRTPHLEEHKHTSHSTQRRHRAETQAPKENAAPPGMSPEE